MIPCKTLVLIVSCEATKDRREACLETWLSHVIPDGIAYKFVVGRPGKPASLCGDILYVDCPDTYIGLPIKTWAMIREALARFEFEWLFKCDDDTFVNLHRLANYSKTHEFMGRHAALCGDDPNWHKTEVGPREKVGTANYKLLDEKAKQTQWFGGWANGGGGYFLSKRACGLVAKEPLSHVEKELYEDKLVGDIMRSHGIHLNGAHSTLRHKVDPNSLNHLLGATTLHPLIPKDMRRVYWKLLRMGELLT
jgi:hypothetical protein